MTPAQLIARAEALGLSRVAKRGRTAGEVTLDPLALAMQVDPGTVRRWSLGKNPIPTWVEMWFAQRESARQGTTGDDYGSW